MMCDFPSPHEDVSWIREEFWQEDKVQGFISGQMWWLKAFLQQAQLSAGLAEPCTPSLVSWCEQCGGSWERNQRAMCLVVVHRFYAGI